MTLGLLFWILMLLWLVGYGYGFSRTPADARPGWFAVAPNALLFILLLCLGWKVFGSPIQ